MRIVMVCAYGMSTSMLMKKMEAAAAETGLSVDISAHSPGEVEVGNFDCDIILLGPQVAYNLGKLKEIYPNTPVHAIDMSDYGMMNGKAVLTKAQKLVAEHIK